MKHIICTLLVMAATIAATQATAQTMKLDSEGISFGGAFGMDRDSANTVSANTVITYRKKSGLCIGRNVKSSIPMVELGWNIPTDLGYGAYEGTGYGDFLDIREWKSTQFTLNLLQASAFARSRNFGVAIAVGIRANNYRLRNSMTLTDDNGLTVPVALEGEIKKSKFTTAAIHIPAELSFGNPYKFALAVGGFVDMVINSHTKVKHKGGSKDKEHNFPVNFIQAGATVRLSFRNFSVYGNYTPTQLFKTGRGPEMRTWTIGIGW